MSDHVYIKDEAVSLLRKDDQAFVRVSVSLYPRFATPSFEDFLRVKLLDNMVPLTEQATQLLLQGGQYARAKRTLGKELRDLAGILVRQAKEFGFAEIFIEEPNDVFAGLAAFLRRLFTPPVPRTGHQQQGQPY